MKDKKGFWKGFVKKFFKQGIALALALAVVISYGLFRSSDRVLRAGGFPEDAETADGASPSEGLPGADENPFGELGMDGSLLGGYGATGSAPVELVLNPYEAVTDTDAGSAEEDGSLFFSQDDAAGEDSVTNADRDGIPFADAEDPSGAADAGGSPAGGDPAGGSAAPGGSGSESSESPGIFLLDPDDKGAITASGFGQEQDVGNESIQDGSNAANESLIIGPSDDGERLPDEGGGMTTDDEDGTVPDIDADEADGEALGDDAGGDADADDGEALGDDADTKSGDGADGRKESSSDDGQQIFYTENAEEDSDSAGSQSPSSEDDGPQVLFVEGAEKEPGSAGENATGTADRREIYTTEETGESSVENKKTDDKETEDKETEGKETEGKETEGKETEDKETEDKETEGKEKHTGSGTENADDNALDTLRAAAEDGAVITVQAAGGILPEGAHVKATAVPYDQVRDALQDTLQNSGEILGAAAYDIQILDAQGREVEPDGSIRVSIRPAAAQAGTASTLYQITPDGAVKTIQ